MLSLPEDPFQADLTRALSGNAEGLEAWWPDPERGAAGLSVYRNTIVKGLTDALVANFPSVVAVVGAEWMRDAARLHAAEFPPTKAPLIDYGEHFPGWLSRFEPADAVPFLTDLAQLDRMWTLAHLAEDVETLASEVLAGLAPEDFETTSVQLRPDVQFAGFSVATPDLWRTLRTVHQVKTFDLSSTPQAIAIHRPQGTVETLDLCPAGLAFLEDCRCGLSLATAAQSAMTANPGADLGQVFAALIEAGIFANLQSTLKRDEPNV